MKKEKIVLKATLCYPIRKDELLLSRKVVDPKIHKPGAGKLNGYGGGLEKGETLRGCCGRETEEECGIKIDQENTKKVAIVYFKNTMSNGEVFICEVHVYFSYKWTGEPKDGDGMKDPRWVSKFNMPWGEMVVGDRQWLPVVISGKKIIAHIEYGPYQSEIIHNVEITEVTSFPNDD